VIVELIAALQECPPSARVVVDGQVDGFDSIIGVINGNFAEAKVSERWVGRLDHTEHSTALFYAQTPGGARNDAIDSRAYNSMKRDI
jgi:hypothetical protein